MGTSKRERQKLGHQARLSAERAAMVRYQRRRRIITSVLVVVGVVAVAALFVVLSRSGDSSTAASSTTSTSSTSTTAPLESALGKPCVELSGELPAGAPEVPMPVGEPPAQLVTEDLVVGSGTPVALGDAVSVNYIGVSCSTGEIFDSSWKIGAPVDFELVEGSLIEGWTEGIPGMLPGGRRLLVIPPDQGYGAAGRSPSIAPDETLVFVVDLVSAGPATTTTTAAP